MNRKSIDRDEVLKTGKEEIICHTSMIHQFVFREKNF